MSVGERWWFRTSWNQIFFVSLWPKSRNVREVSRNLAFIFLVYGSGCFSSVFPCCLVEINRIRRQDESKIPLCNPSGGNFFLRPSASCNKLMGRITFRIVSTSTWSFSPKIVYGVCSCRLVYREIVKVGWHYLTCGDLEILLVMIRLLVTRLKKTAQQTFVLMKTSWRHLKSSFSEEVFKRSSIRLDQDLYICLSHTSSEDVLVKTSIFVLAIRLQDVFKKFSRWLQDVLQKRFQGIFKTSSRRLPRCLQNVFKKSSRRLQDVLQRCLQDHFKTYHQVKLWLLTNL